jgi:transcriptional regulator with XRE-family HTH domain
MKDIIGARVRKLREDLGLSQTEMAALITARGFGPLSYQAIQQLEDGSVKKPRYAVHLAKVLRTSWEYLIGETDNPVGVVNGLLGNHVPLSQSVQSEVRDREGRPQMIAEMSHMLGLMEGRMEARAEARFSYVKDKLDNHEKRLEALEGQPQAGPQRGRRR